MAGILDWLGLGGDQQQSPEQTMIQGMQQTMASGGIIQQPDASGFYDVTGDTAAGVRGDEVQDTADLLGYIIQGATPQMIRMEARRRKFTLADFKRVMSIARNAQQVAQMVGLNTGGILPDPRFAPLVQMLAAIMGHGRRRRRRQISLKKGLEALVYMGKVAHAIKSAGRAVASLSRERVVVAKGGGGGVFGRPSLKISRG